MTRITRHPLFQVLLLLAVTLPTLVWAQDADVPAETKTTFWQLLKQGSWFMIPLAVLSIATVSLAVVGFMNVPEKKMLTPHLVPQLEEALSAVNIPEAKSVCTSNPSLLTNIMMAGLQRIDDGYLDMESMEKAMEEASVEETASGLKMINYLSIVAQLAPMVGLLGTVSGMIKAFQKIGQGGMGSPEKLADNIGEAMITTATGLIIGIPAMFLFFYLKSRYTGNVTRLGRVLGNLTHHLASAVRRSQAPTGDSSLQPGMVLGEPQG